MTESFARKPDNREFFLQHADTRRRKVFFFFLFTRIDRSDRKNVIVDVRHPQLAGKKIYAAVSLIFTSPERNSSFDYQERIFFANPEDVRTLYGPFPSCNFPYHI